MARRPFLLLRTLFRPITTTTSAAFKSPAADRAKSLFDPLAGCFNPIRTHPPYGVPITMITSVLGLQFHCNFKKYLGKIFVHFLFQNVFKILWPWHCCIDYDYATTVKITNYCCNLNILKIEVYMGCCALWGWKSLQNLNTQTFETLSFSF